MRTMVLVRPQVKQCTNGRPALSRHALANARFGPYARQRSLLARKYVGTTGGDCPRTLRRRG
eukprot:5042270-Lingulodinium_polyedra.AAC.1